MNIETTLANIAAARKAVAMVLPLRQDPKWEKNEATGHLVSATHGVPLQSMDGAYRLGYEDAVQEISARLLELALSGQQEAMIMAIGELSKRHESKSLWS